MKPVRVVANSPSMVNLINMAKGVSETDSTILFLGETGVGKGLIARVIHESGNRKANIIVTISCDAIPEDLLESELFGCEVGAFSGASNKGKIELANKGKLFLDEIGELPFPLQVKILQVIQKGIITRIGGTREIELDVNFISATIN